MIDNSKVKSKHTRRAAVVYIRQSHPSQVENNRESTARQYALVEKATALGWAKNQVITIDEDLGVSGKVFVKRSGFDHLNAKSVEVRTYLSEKKHPGRRHWEGKGEQQQATYANRRRIQGAYGKQLLRKRGELLERSFAHCYDTGGMRRTHLRGHENILKRLLIHVGAFNLSLIFRSLLGSGTPRELSNRESALVFLLLWLFPGPSRPVRPTNSSPRSARFRSWRNHRYLRYKVRHSGKNSSATDC